ncbi:MAG: hypothetical protein WBC44_16530 [Planctomycetaceae bacterium]
MARRRQDAGDLEGDGIERLERKLDRLTRLVVALLLCQPILFVGLIMPDTATQLLTCALLVLLGLLLAFPNLETALPSHMRRLGRTFGRMRDRFRSMISG